MKRTGLIFLLLLVLAVLFVQKWKDLSKDNDALRQRGFDRRTSTLEYTKHARCRMDCRHITETDINEIMLDGEINYAKSDLRDEPCPTYALQGHTTDGQYLRVVFAQCESETKVVTCYDLEKDFECHCPGDEKKNKR